jgi:hypothetical protein
LRNDVRPSVLGPGEQKIIKTDDFGESGKAGAVAPENRGNGLSSGLGAGEAQALPSDVERVALDPAEDSCFRENKAFFLESGFQAPGMYESAAVVKRLNG